MLSIVLVSLLGCAAVVATSSMIATWAHYAEAWGDLNAELRGRNPVQIRHVVLPAVHAERMGALAYAPEFRPQMAAVRLPYAVQRLHERRAAA